MSVLPVKWRFPEPGVLFELLGKTREPVKGFKYPTLLSGLLGAVPRAAVGAAFRALRGGKLQKEAPFAEVGAEFRRKVDALYARKKGLF